MNLLLQGDALDVLRTLSEKSIECCVTSPPYWNVRDYGVDGQLGMEQNPVDYVNRLVEIFKGVKRVLKDDGTLWLNLGSSYANKQLIGIPWMVALALQQDGWFLRSDIIWEKPNAMPSSVRDRPTPSHEYIFLFAKSPRYYYDNEAIKEDATDHTHKQSRAQGNKQDALGKRTYSGFNERYVPVEKRNKRTVWRVTTKPFKGAHFATFPPDLIEPCILAGCPEGGTVLDPFFGAGTTGLVAINNNRNYIGIELNPEYIEIAQARLEVAETAR